MNFPSYVKSPAGRSIWLRDLGCTLAKWGIRIAGWWFGTFFIFPYIGNNHPNWLIFFRGVETTNQIEWSFLRKRNYRLTMFLSSVLSFAARRVADSEVVFTDETHWLLVHSFRRFQNWIWICGTLIMYNMLGICLIYVYILVCKINRSISHLRWTRASGPKLVHRFLVALAPTGTTLSR